MEMILEMLFFSLSNVDVGFAELEKLISRIYIAAKALPTISWVKLISKKEFAKAILDENSMIFIVHISTVEVTIIHPFQAAQIAALQWNKAFIEIPIECFDYIDIFSINLAMELPENTGINKHAIKLIKRKQLLYKLIYALSLMELETLKTYIKIYLKAGFIQPFKSPIGAPILFDKKLDNIFYLYIDYQGLNNLMIKNQYLLLLISKF